MKSASIFTFLTSIKILLPIFPVLSCPNPHAGGPAGRLRGLALPRRAIVHHASSSSQISLLNLLIFWLASINAGPVSNDRRAIRWSRSACKSRIAGRDSHRFQEVEWKGIPSCCSMNFFMLPPLSLANPCNVPLHAHSPSYIIHLPKPCCSIWSFENIHSMKG